MTDRELARKNLENVIEQAKAATRGERRRGRLPKNLVAVNAYQGELEDTYDEWSDTFSDDISNATPEERQSIIDSKTAILLALLIALGRRRIPEAIDLGLEDVPVTPALLRLLADTLSENERYLTDSFIADLKAKIDRALHDPDVIAAFALSKEDGRDAVRAILSTMQARIALYSGEFWKMFNISVGYAADETGKALYWHRDSQAKSCEDCLEYGDREYTSYRELLLQTNGRAPAMNVRCGSNCRCWLTPSEGD